ncbi:MAG: rhomboid family intramembrane serine protease [Gammaproteobacteria bacterium]
MLIPYRLALNIYRVPYISIGIIVTCVLVFLAQLHNSSSIYGALQGYCDTHKDGRFQRVARAIHGPAPWHDSCITLLYEIHVAEEPKRRIAQFAAEAPGLARPNRENSKRRIQEVLTARYADVRRNVPRDLTSTLVYQSGSFNVARMFTSDVAHAGWMHLIFNLIFFAAFAPAVELILGTGGFLVALTAVVLGEHLIFSLWHAGSDPPVTVVGLSGVVAAMMGLLTYLWPGARIRCLLVIVVVPIRVTLPALLLAVGFVGWDIYYLTESPDSGVSFISHVGGFAVAIAYGALFLRRTKRELPALIGH